MDYHVAGPYVSTIISHSQKTLCVTYTVEDRLADIHIEQSRYVGIRGDPMFGGPVGVPTEHA